MNKLNREQADWILKQIKKALDAGYKDIDVDCNVEDSSMIKTLEQIINQCTEQEPPIVKVMFNNGGIMRIYKDEIGVNINTKYKQYDVDCEFTIDSFKEFAEGCNKIVEWLEENEDAETN